MSSIEEIRERLKTQEAALYSLERSILETRKELAKATCPFPIGSVLVDYKGRKRRLSRVEPHEYRSYDYQMYGYNILKDGSNGAESLMQSYREWRLAREGE